ncbi:MAG: hypothetical protein P8Y18_11535 [Candidatus Bathyarchaeota archaeon]
MSVKRKLSVLLSVSLFSIILLSSVNAQYLKLFVSDIEFNSNEIKIGEEANLRITIKNLSENRESCDVTIFCGGKIINQQQILVEPLSTFVLQHNFNTSHMSTVTYSIETLIESQDQSQMFGLGKIELVNDSILPIVKVDSFDSPILMILTPLATVLSVVFLMRRWRKQSKESEEELDLEQIPKLLGGVFSMQQNSLQPNEETEIHENDDIQCKNAYIC